jgi:hypothetical protein
MLLLLLNLLGVVAPVTAAAATAALSCMVLPSAMSRSISARPEPRTLMPAPHKP